MINKSLDWTSQIISIDSNRPIFNTEVILGTVL
jgi:hypothetical protein